MAHAGSEWIVKLHYAFQDAENLYMVMDFMPGVCVCVCVCVCSKTSKQILINFDWYMYNNKSL